MGIMHLSNSFRGVFSIISMSSRDFLRLLGCCFCAKLRFDGVWFVEVVLWFLGVDEGGCGGEEEVLSVVRGIDWVVGGEFRLVAISRLALS